LFVVAAATDFLDGYVARKFNQITTFGKFLDPIADKVLTFTALLFLMITMTNRPGLPIYVMLACVVVILIREFAVTGIRLLAVEKQTVIAASHWGKFKTITKMIAIVILLFNDFNLPAVTGIEGLVWIGNSVYFLAVLLTIISGVDYFIKNRQAVLESM
jgi:CDP-diacylglycerol--glycerol-3-phosphate 3-phosphatidyltransferase